MLPALTLNTKFPSVGEQNSQDLDFNYDSRNGELARSTCYSKFSSNNDIDPELANYKHQIHHIHHVSLETKHYGSSQFLFLNVRILVQIPLVFQDFATFTGQRTS